MGTPGGARRFGSARGRLRAELLEDRALPSIYLGTNVAGLDYGNNGLVPSDPSIAANPTAVVETVQDVIVSDNKSTGTQLTPPQSLCDFFATVKQPNEIIKNPAVAYDEYTGRFIVAAEAHLAPGGIGGYSALYIAVLESGGGAINMPFGGPLDIPLPPPLVPPANGGNSAAAFHPRAALFAAVASGNHARLAADAVTWTVIADSAPQSLALPAPATQSQRHRQSVLLNDLADEALALERGD
jgi:hypothetical protein